MFIMYNGVFVKKMCIHINEIWKKVNSLVSYWLWVDACTLLYVMLSGKLNLFVHYENWSMNMLYLCISVTVWSCTFVVYIGVYCWYVCMHCSNCLTNTTSALFWGWRNVTSVFARGRVWRSEGHVLLGLAREFFLFVCCSRSARSKHVFLNIFGCSV